MVNVQSPIQDLLRSAATLATMSISRSGAAGLPLPVWAVIGVHAAAPGGVVIAAHLYPVGLIEAFLAAILILGTLHLVALAGERLAASATNYFYLGMGLANDSSGALPRTTALARTEIVFRNRAWWEALLFAAPITGDESRRKLTRDRTVGPLAAPNVPRGALKFLAASSAFDLHIDSLAPNVNAVKSGNERVGLAHWLNEPRQLELNGA